MFWVRRHRFLLILLALSLVVRVAMSVDRDRWPFSEDEHHWERLGLLYATHGLWEADTGSYRPPLYPLMIGAVYTVLGADPLAIRILQACLATLTVFLVYLCARRLGSERIALTSAALAAVYPLWTFVSTMMMAETLLVLLVVTSVLLTVRFVESPGVDRGLALGFVLGLGILCKPVVLLWALVLIPAAWLRGGADVRGRANATVAVAAGLLFAVTPWTIRNEVVTGHRLLVSTNLGMNLMIGHEPRARGQYIDGRDYVTMFNRLAGETQGAVERDRAVAGEIYQVIAENPWRSIELGFRKTFLFWNSMLSDAPRWAVVVHFFTGTGIVLLGVVGLVQNRKEDLAWVAISCALTWTAIHAVFFSHARFRLPVDLVWMPFVAAGLTTVWASVHAAVSRRLRELDAG